MDLFMDDDGTAYHVRTSFTVVKLTADFLGPEELSSEIEPPHSSEAPVMFRRGDYYYVLVGNDCCYCVGGSNALVMMANSPTGPWVYAGDVGSVPEHKYDTHSPNNFITNAQAQKVFSVPPVAGSTTAASSLANSFVWLGMQWGSGLKETPPGPRHHDLTYWSVLQFNANGTIKQMVALPNATFPHLVAV